MKAVVFDMDGVIFDTEAAAIECWNEIGRRHSIEGIEKVCRECIGINSRASAEVFRRYYGPDFPYNTYRTEMFEILYARIAHNGPDKKPGVCELLTFLKEQGIRIALASSTSRENVVRELTDAGLIDFFDKLVCGDMVTHSKPDPEIFLTACREIGVEPSEAYAIEDSHNGIRAASAAGMKPIMVPDLCPATDEIRALTLCVLPSLNDVQAYFEQERPFEGAN